MSSFFFGFFLHFIPSFSVTFGLYLIAALPDVKWVLPDSFIVDGDNRYGGLICSFCFVSFPQ